MDAPSDRALVARVRQGEVNAYGELVRRYQVSVFNTCYRMLTERRAAEDMAQETFLRGYSRLSQFDSQRPFGPWIRKIAVNLCLNQLQRIQPSTRPLLEELDAAPQSRTHPEIAIERKEKTERIRDAVANLPPHYRAVIELRHFQGLTYQQMSETLQLPLNTVRSHLFRARRVLAAILRDEFHHPS